MSIRQPRFEIHKAQKVAAALLTLFFVQALWLVAHLPLNLEETRNALAGQALWSSRQLSATRPFLIPGDSILTLRCAGALPALAHLWQGSDRKFSIYAAPNRWLVRLPFVLFGTWLGGALWWVARRIFGNEGGYVALALYCFNPPMLLKSSTAGSAILASWGLFGLVFTAIGVAHTLYAPPRKWRPRILLLGAAIGLTAGASIPAVIAGLLFGAAFMFFLAPGRRLACLTILVLGSLIGAFVLLLLFGFRLRYVEEAITVTSEYLAFTAHRAASVLYLPGGLLVVFTFLTCLLVFLFWKRTRYFGTAAPLLVALLLPWWPGRYLPDVSIIWAVPFALVFAGGIYADLLEPGFFRGRFRRFVAATAVVLVGSAAVLSALVVAYA